MDSKTAPEVDPVPNFGSAPEYRRSYGRSTMVLASLRGATASREELCQVASVDTISTGLWITVRFLNGSTRGLRPEMIRLATAGERELGLSQS